VGDDPAVVLSAEESAVVAGRMSQAVHTDRRMLNPVGDPREEFRRSMMDFWPLQPLRSYSYDVIDCAGCLRAGS
jgi:hypothetical protein